MIVGLVTPVSAGRLPRLTVASTLSRAQMKRVIGIAIGITLLGITAFTQNYAIANWRAGHADIGVWFTVIAGLLAIAGLGAIIGTWLHTSETKG